MPLTRTASTYGAGASRRLSSEGGDGVNDYLNSTLAHLKTLEMNNWKDKYIDMLIREDVDVSVAFKARHIPERLFKYTSLSERKKEKLEALKSDKIWISSPTSMNDPYDSALVWNGADLGQQLFKDNFEEATQRIGLINQMNTAELDEIRKSDDFIKGMVTVLQRQHPESAARIDEIVSLADPLFQERTNQLQHELSERLRSSLKISCFTELNNCLPMWAHYAGNHAGFCVEYNFRDLSGNDLRQRLLFPVLYQQDMIDVTKLLLEQEDRESLMALLASLNKGMDWSYEREWRLVIRLG